MSGILQVRKSGNSMIVLLEDGTQISALPTGRGIWLVGGSLDSVSPAPGTGTGGTTGTVRDSKDDYPWPRAPYNTSVSSPLGYGYRECVDFVAWRMNRDLGDTSSPWTFNRFIWPAFPAANGDAIGWQDDWTMKGWTHSNSPAPGMVGWYGPKAGAFGHVNYVQSVASGSIVVEEYNWGGTHNYGTRTISTSGGAAYPDSFLQIPPL